MPATGAETAPHRPPRRRALRSSLFAALALGALYVVVPRLAGLEHTWQRIRDGSPGWLVAAILFEVLSFAGYVWLLRRVATRRTGPLPWREAWRITLAGVAATRIVTVGGAGGIAVTVAGLRRAGFSTREAAERQAVHLVALYAVFFGALAADGTFLAATHGGPGALTLVPAGAGAVVIALALALQSMPSTFERWVATRAGRHAATVAALPAVVAAGVRDTLTLVRRRDLALWGAVGWWAFDMAAFWASLRAFGGSAAVPTLIMAYLAGHAFNVLPVPGGVGPVEGGLIAALVAFGQPAGLALVAVLAYQLIAVWLPAAPGALALASLRRAPAADGGAWARPSLGAGNSSASHRPRGR